ncbi:hypothetical protein [Kiloniella sp. EL199]|nr:hypothetical protein [Kiloniella sp. EL199]
MVLYGLVCARLAGGVERGRPAADDWLVQSAGAYSRTFTRLL